MCDIPDGALKVFYVQPTGPSPECPSPCHSLEYYVNHSNFTNSSKFLFLEGEHHLKSLAVIRNVDNLSLVGVGLVVVLVSCSAGFHIANLSMGNMMIISKKLSCSTPGGVSLNLLNGSDVKLSHMMINTTSDYQSGLSARDVVGSFSISDSIFCKGGEFAVEYRLCNNKSSLFEFRRSLLQHVNLDVAVFCLNVEVTITNSSFQGEYCRVDMYFNVLTENFVLVKNSTFGANLTLTTCSDVCDVNHLQCSENFLIFSEVTFHSGSANFVVGYHIHTADCVVLIENSSFYDGTSYNQLVMDFDYDGTGKGTSAQAILHNVTFVNNHLIGPVSVLVNAVVIFEDCTFRNNSQTAIHAENSMLIFQGNCIFTNNFAHIGGGIQLLQSYMLLRPNTSIQFDRNHADFVGGAIYTDNFIQSEGQGQGPCSISLMCQSSTTPSVLN